MKSSIWYYYEIEKNSVKLDTEKNYKYLNNKEPKLCVINDSIK